MMRSPGSTHTLQRVLLSLTTLTLISGCGLELERSSEVNSLRVLAVQKSSPYARPGTNVELNMLWADGAEPTREVNVMWLGGCVNPPGDLYYGCFAHFAEGAGGAGGATSGGLPPGLTVGSGDTFTLPIPDDIISSRPRPSDPTIPPYGLSYVFFAACAGEIEPASDPSAGFPVVCRDPQTGKLREAEGFVAGYSAIYVYENHSNANPVITGFEVNGVAVEPDCIGTACLEPQPLRECTGGTDIACIDACPDDGDPASCPGFSIRPVIDPASAEIDSISAESRDRTFREQMWIRYYTDAGSVKSDARLLNDATKGWNEDYGTIFYAPKETRRINLWAVVHDNRGGVNWVRVPIVTR